WAVEHVEGYLTSQGTYEVGAPGIETMLCAEERTSRIVVGCVHFTIIGPDEGQAEIGYSFNSKFTGQGFATEAVVALMGFVFNSMGMHRICAGVDARNERSWKLMERVGMRREAHFVDANFEDGHWVDDYVYGMLKSEWIDRYAT
ncbi:MAG: GNAT family protein, partial [Planctomycetota bacterium]